MVNITYILVGLILIIGGALAGFGLPFLKSKLSVDQINTLKQIVNIAVYAAEQLLGPKMGADKKKFALEYAKKLLAKYNLTFDDDAVDAAIEAQVKELKIAEGGNA
jgi:LL-H family phage holin